MPGLPVYHQVGTTVTGNNAPAQSQGAGVASSGTSGSQWKFMVWVLIIGLVVPGMILGGLDFKGYRFVFKSRG